jgi:hypothetical protein
MYSIDTVLLKIRISIRRFFEICSCDVSDSDADNPSRSYCARIGIVKLRAISEFEPADTGIL